MTELDLRVERLRGFTLEQRKKIRELILEFALDCYHDSDLMEEVWQISQEEHGQEKMSCTTEECPL